MFTLDGKVIRELKLEYHFRKAHKTAGIKDFTFHDLRHCAITRWGAAGVPTAAAMLARSVSVRVVLGAHAMVTKNDATKRLGMCLLVQE